MKPKAIRGGLTVEPGTYTVEGEWVSGAHLRGADGQMRPFAVTLSVKDAELILRVAHDEEQRMAAIEAQAASIGAEA